MKLSKRVISVLLSTSYVFTNIVFAAGPGETPKTGIKKLESVHLADVAQCMPMTEKIKFEQVSKNCGESLKMGYADNFLFCYELLNRHHEVKPRIATFKDYRAILQAFSSSGKLYVLTQDITKLDYFKNNFSDFKCLVKPVGFFYNYRKISKYVVFLPRSYNVTSAYDGSYTNKLPELLKFEKWLFDDNYVLPDDKDIHDGESVLCMQGYFDLNRIKIIESCSDRNISELTDMYYMPVEQRYYYQGWNSIHYNSDPAKVILSAEGMTNSLDFASELQEYVYQRMSELARNGDCTRNKFAELQKRFSELVELLKQWKNLFWYENRDLVLNIKKFVSELGEPVVRVFGSNTPTHFDEQNQLIAYQSVFSEFLPQDISCLGTFFINASDADEIYTVPWTDYTEFKNAFKKLDDYYKKPANRIITTKPLVCLPKFDEDALLNNFLNHLTTANLEVTRACVCVIPEEDKSTTWYVGPRRYKIFSEGKLKSTIYLLSKAGCTYAKFVEIGGHILNSLKSTQPAEAVKTAEKILDDAKNLHGEFADLEPWSKTPVPVSNLSGAPIPPTANAHPASGIHTRQTANAHPASSIHTRQTANAHPASGIHTRQTAKINHATGTCTQKSESTSKSNFGTALVGATGLAALGALAYNGIKKYINKSSNISKPKNNKKIVKNCS